MKINLIKLFSIYLLLCLQACNIRPSSNIEQQFAEAVELQNNNQPEDAIKLYYDILSKTNDLHILSKTYHNLGAIYMWDKVFDKASGAYVKAYQLDSLKCDTSHMIQALEAMGTIYFWNKDSLNTKRFYMHATQLAQLSNDSTRLAEIYRKEGWHYYQIGQLDSALYYTYLSLDYSKNPSLLYSTLADIWYQQHHIDSARHYFNLGIYSPNTQDRLPSLFSYAQMEHQLGNDKIAYKHLLAYTLGADTLYAQQRTRELEKLSYKHEAELKVRIVEERHNFYISLITLLLITIAAFFLLIIQHQLRKKHELQIQYEANLQGLNEKICLLKQNLQTGINERETLQQHTEAQIAQLRAVTLKQTIIGKRLIQLSQQDNRDKRNIKVLTEKEQTELQKVVTDIYKDEIIRLKTNYPRLTEGDLLYYCLNSAGFSTLTIALCFGNTDTGIIAQRKRRMKQRMNQSDK